MRRPRLGALRGRRPGRRVTATPGPDPAAAGGPDVWANWKAWELGAETLGAYEAVRYTDAHVTGEALHGLGPYRAYNALGAVGLHGSGVGAGVVLRVEQHASNVLQSPVEHRRTSVEHYVGAAPLSDQFACLLSVALGARFRSGGETREFEPGGEPRGRPAHISHQVPSIGLPRGGSVLPDVAGRTVLLDAAIPVLASLQRLDAAQATRVVRAARLYRQALWTADDDPELSWLLLVSAAEVGATQWARRSGRGTPGSRRHGSRRRCPSSPSSYAHTAARGSSTTQPRSWRT